MTLAARQGTLARDFSTAAAKFEALSNQTGIFAGIMDLQGSLREANDLALESCGYTREQVVDRPFWDTPWWRGSEETKARIRFATDQAAAGLVFREELRYWVADGGERIVDFAMHPIRDRSGAVMFLHPTGIDITERKHVEAALRESEQRLRWSASIVESSDDAIVSKNLDGIITSWNRGAARIFGYTADEAIGQPITIVIPQDRQDEERAILTRTQTGRAYRPFRDGAPKQARQLDRRFTDSFTCQKCRGENCRSIEDRAGYYCAEAKPRAKRHVGSGSRAPK